MFIFHKSLKGPRNIRQIFVCLFFYKESKRPLLLLCSGRNETLCAWTIFSHCRKSTGCWKWSKTLWKVGNVVSTGRHIPQKGRDRKHPIHCFRVYRLGIKCFIAENTFSSEILPRSPVHEFVKADASWTRARRGALALCVGSWLPPIPHPIWVSLKLQLAKVSFSP